MNKVYVCSDIHAHHDKLLKAMKMLNQNDLMYVIGDVVDKGPDGLLVLREIMHDKRIIFLIGNHDLMMLCVVKGLRSQKLQASNIFNDVYRNWIDYNNGQETLDIFNSYNFDEQNEMINYLENSAVLLNVKVAEREFVLVHAYPYNIAKNNVYLKDLKDNETKELYDWTSPYVWNREKDIKIKNKIVITGHTPTYFYGTDKIYHNDYWYDIDCNLAILGKKAKLGVLSLNDLKEYYY